MSTKLSEHKDESDILSLVQRISISIHVQGHRQWHAILIKGVLKTDKIKQGYNEWMCVREAGG